MTSVKTFLQKRLKLKVNEQKSAVGRPWERKFLGYSMTIEKNPRLKPAKESIRRFRDKIIEKTSKGRGRNIQKLIREELNPFMRGWANYYGLSSVKQVFEDVDSWVRRRLPLLLDHSSPVLFDLT
jgi:RNA-directed DNA polymerase